MNTQASTKEDLPTPTPQKTESVPTEESKPKVQAAPEPRPELIELTDRSTILWLIYSKVGWHHKERKIGYKTIFWYERLQNTIKLLERLQSPEPIMVDFRELMQAEALFNSAVKDQF